MGFLISSLDVNFGKYFDVIDIEWIVFNLLYIKCKKGLLC